MVEHIDPDLYTKLGGITKTSHRDPYPAIAPENPANSQKGRIIIVTGASSGIGEAAAKVWARAGASGIVLAARRLDKLEAVEKEIKSINPDAQVLSVKTDVSSEDNVKNLYVKVQKTFGRSADVILNNAGFVIDEQLIGETPFQEWWGHFETNLKGLYLMSHYFIQSQANPKEPTGTLITVSSGRAAMTIPGGSGYNITKLSEQKLNEHLQLEYPTLRVFTTHPGIVATSMVLGKVFEPWAKDHVDLTGMLALYLMQPRADFLKASFISVTWDVDELEEYKEDIVGKKLLQASFLPIWPLEGGKGLGA